MLVDLFDYVLCVFLYFCITISFNTLIPIDNPHATPIEIDMTLKQQPARDNVIELEVVAMIVNVSSHFNIVVDISYFEKPFFSLIVFIFEVSNLFLNVVKWVVKTIYVI